MNLRKATKKQLIQEIRRLRLFEECAKQYREEIKRRDAASAKFKQFEEEILCYALEIALKAKTWDDFWEEQKQYDKDGFWAERKADKIAKMVPIIETAVVKPIEELTDQIHQITEEAKSVGI